MTTASSLLVVPGIARGFRFDAYDDVLRAAEVDHAAVVKADLNDIVAQASSEASPENGAAAVVDALAQLAGKVTTGPVDVLAESLGASFAIRLASTHPELVRSLVVSSPPGYAGPVSASTRPAPLSTALRRLYGGTAELDDILTVLHGPAVTLSPELVLEYEGYRNGIAAQTAEVLARWSDAFAFDSARMPDRDSEVRSLRQPVQLVWGREDSVTGIDSAFFLMRRMRNAQLRGLSQAGHLVSQAAPGAYGRLLRVWFETPHEQLRSRSA